MNEVEKYKLLEYFMLGKGKTSDYEMEIDLMASHIGLAISFCNDLELQKDLTKVVELLYHLNSSVRKKCYLEPKDSLELQKRVEYYKSKIKNKNTLVLPLGSKTSASLHIARAISRKCIRLVHFIENEENKKIDELVFSLLNIISNYLFILSLYNNELENINEVKFISKNYQ